MLWFTHGAHVARDISAHLFLVSLDEVVNHTVSEILTAEMSITGGDQYFEGTIIYRKKNVCLH